MTCASSVADHPEPGEIANNQSHKGATPPRPVGAAAVEDRPADHEQAEEEDPGADRPEQEVGDRLDPAALGIQPEVDVAEVESEQDEHQADQEEDQEQEGV